MAFTNDLAYVDFAVDISNMDFDDVVLLPLFCQLTLATGNVHKNDVKFHREIDLYTGGIEVYPIVDEVVQTNSEGAYVVPDGKHRQTKIAVRSSCVAGSGGMGMFTLIKQLLFDANVNNRNKVIELLEKVIDDMDKREIVHLDDRSGLSYIIMSSVSLTGDCEGRSL